MPRKFFRRFLPDHESVRQNRYVAWFGPRLQHPNLWHLNRRSVAGGVAAGLFAGLIPGSNPVQFAAGAILAIVSRVNLPIAVFVTFYSNPFTIVPLYFIAYQLGQLALLQSGGGLPPLAAAIVTSTSAFVTSSAIVKVTLAPSMRLMACRIPTSVPALRTSRRSSWLLTLEMPIT